MVARPGRSTGRNARGRAEHTPTRERRALVGASCARPPGPLTGTERPRACRACPCRGVAGPCRGERSSPAWAAQRDGTPAGVRSTPLQGSGGPRRGELRSPVSGQSTLLQGNGARAELTPTGELFCERRGDLWSPARAAHRDGTPAGVQSTPLRGSGGRAKLAPTGNYFGGRRGELRSPARARSTGRNACGRAKHAPTGAPGLGA